MLIAHGAQAQIEQDSLDAADKRTIEDESFISEVENKYDEPDKVLHAEPLYIDLIRDLGARKGEREWNYGVGIANLRDKDAYEALVEYEWAPMDRLGLELELPIHWDMKNSRDTLASLQPFGIASFKAAAQYTYYVSTKHATSLAIGYIHQLITTSFREVRNGDNFIYGNNFNPFLVGAKRWGNNFHSLIYTGPSWLTPLNPSASQGNEFQWEMHSNFHYMIPGTRNFVGVEVNKYFYEGGEDITFRPQMRVGIAHNLLVGIVVGIPATQTTERGISTFMRIFYEPSSPATKQYKPGGSLISH